MRLMDAIAARFRQSQSSQRFAARQFALELDGVVAGRLEAVSGGVIRGEVSLQHSGVDPVVKKQISSIHYEPFHLIVSLGSSQVLMDWIRNSFERGCVTKNGTIAIGDAEGRIERVHRFYDALITAVNIPPLDAGSKEPGYFSLTIDPASIRYEPGDGAKLTVQPIAKQKRWQVSNFRLTLGDLPCDRVSKIEALTFKQKVVEHSAGQRSTQVEIPNLKLSIARADMAAWEEWHRSFVIDGKGSEEEELKGQIEFLAPDQKEVLGSIQLKQVGIVAFDPLPIEVNQKISPFTVELYVERMAIVS